MTCQILAFDVPAPFLSMSVFPFISLDCFLALLEPVSSASLSPPHKPSLFRLLLPLSHPPFSPHSLILMATPQSPQPQWQFPWVTGWLPKLSVAQEAKLGVPIMAQW